MDIMEIEKALEGLRTGLRKDGADLVVSHLSTGSIELSLILKNDTCLGCIVDTDLLLAMVRLALGKSFPQMTKVVLHDPRSSQKSK